MSRLKKAVLSGASLAAIVLAAAPVAAQTPVTGADAQPETPGRVAGGTTGVTAPAAGSTPPSATTSDADGDVIVTARRTEERLQDVPISITVFNQQQIQNRNIVTAGDLATYTPSLTANSRFGEQSTSFAIRGFVQEGATSPSVAVYFADVVAPRANGGTTAGNGAGVGSLFDLQNVQVLKGPQGTLFGRNTTGGAVLLVPNKPTGEFEGYVEGSIGNYDLRRVQAVVNAPIGDSVRVRLGVDRQKRDGFLNNISGVGPKDFADVDYIALRASLVVDLTPNLENYTIATYSKSDTHGFYPKIFFALPNGYRNAFIRAQIARTSGNYYDIENGLPEAGQEIEQWGVFNTTTFAATDTITLKNIASYQQFFQRQRSNIYGDNGIDTTTTPVSYNFAVTVGNRPGSHNAAQDTFTEEFQLQGRSADDRLNYQAGIYYEKSTPLDGFQMTQSAIFARCTDITTFQCVDIRGRNTVIAPGVNLEGRIGQVSLSNSQYKFRNFGTYAQSTFKITDQLSVTGGIRYTADKTSGIGDPLRLFFPPPGNNPLFSCAQPNAVVRGPLTVANTTGLSAAAAAAATAAAAQANSAAIRADPLICSFSRKVSSKKPTWLIDLDFKPTDDILLYGKYSRGYRQGSVNVSSYGLETWGPEKVDTYEVGAKTSFSGAVRGTFNVAAFYNDFSNQQLQIGTVACTTIFLPQCPFIASPAQGIANAGKSTIKGFEVDATVSPVRGLNLSGAYAYLDTKLKSATLPATPPGFTSLISPPVGGVLPLTPKHKYTLTGSYTLPLDPTLGAVSFAATYTHQSTQFGASSSLPQFQTLPKQRNLNLNANWNQIAGSPVDLQLFVTNVTKEKFRLNTTGGANSFGFESQILNPPRMYGARLRYSFGR